MRILSSCVLVLVMSGCPGQSGLERCLQDCESIGNACNPGNEPGTFSTGACQDVCREPNSRLIDFPDCFPCLETGVMCDVPRFFVECVPVHCWDPEVYNETGMDVPYGSE